MIHLRKQHAGFTVLEFLIVLAIIVILIAIALPSLERARTRSRNEKIVTDLKTIALGLEQFKQSCGEYPPGISKDELCNDDNRGVTLSQFIPVMNDYQFDGGEGDIVYFPIATGTNNNICYSFHIGANLQDASEDYFLGDDNFDSSESPACDGYKGGPGFKGDDPGLFDIVR